MDAVPDHTSFWPFVLYACAVVGLVVLMVGLSYVLGERHKARTTGEPYESGARPVGSAWAPRDLSFYLVAVFFVIFDLEALFIFAWAVALREVGWAGYAEIMVFIAILLAGLVYLWRVGALEVTSRHRPF